MFCCVNSHTMHARKNLWLLFVPIAYALLDFLIRIKPLSPQCFFVLTEEVEVTWGIDLICSSNFAICYLRPYLDSTRLPQVTWSLHETSCSILNTWEGHAALDINDFIRRWISQLPIPYVVKKHTTSSCSSFDASIVLRF